MWYQYTFDFIARAAELFRIMQCSNTIGIIVYTENGMYVLKMYFAHSAFVHGRLLFQNLQLFESDNTC